MKGHYNVTVQNMWRSHICRFVTKFYPRGAKMRHPVLPVNAEMRFRKIMEGPDFELDTHGNKGPFRQLVWTVGKEIKKLLRNYYHLWGVRDYTNLFRHYYELWVRNKKSCCATIIICGEGCRLYLLRHYYELWGEDGREETNKRHNYYLWGRRGWQQTKSVLVISSNYSGTN